MYAQASELAVRWSAVEDVLCSLLTLWEPLFATFAKQNLFLPISSDETVFEEFYSVLGLFRNV